MANYSVSSNHKTVGDRYVDDMQSSVAAWTGKQDPLDTDEAKKEHKRMLEWFYYERDKQSANRMEMALDADFYDGIQWSEEDVAVLRERGQMPLVFNELKPMVDWIIGTERRTRVDWSVLPRTEDDVQLADIKTKVLKYVSDINRVPFARSKAFADAVKVGVGWIDDGARDDPTTDVLYSRYEDWRNVLWDSASYDLDLTDARYVFRWRWVDEDVALMMFPDQTHKILEACEDAFSFDYDDEDLDSWGSGDVNGANRSYRMTGVGGMGSAVDIKRRRVRLIECQYKKPTKCKIVCDGPHAGTIFNEKDLQTSVQIGIDGSEVVDRVMMRVHVAVFTDKHLLALSPSAYRHNRFSLTPIWCYRRSRDRLPYGAIRVVRDIQLDLNKRASKSLFVLNTNQIIADEGVTDDWRNLRDEVDRPDGLIIKRPGKELIIRRDTDMARGQNDMMAMDAQSIQRITGINNENLGRQTNAVSGAAIEARQNQGAVSTTEIFDNLRLAVQVQGEKQLSLTEQFYTEQKVIRLTGAQGGIEWVRINEPEQQPDGSLRYVNDITASKADFIVSEADYAGTLRQVMFDSLNRIVEKLPPEVGLKIFTLAMEFSDLPNKDDIADAIRRMTGDVDPNKELSPEEQQQQMQQQQMQAEMMQMQREQAMLALEEQRAKVAKLNAEAQKIASESPESGDALQQLRAEMSNSIQQLSEQLRRVQVDAAQKVAQMKQDADVRLEIANIDADVKLRIAEMQMANDRRLAKSEQTINQMKQKVTQTKES